MGRVRKPAATPAVELSPEAAKAALVADTVDSIREACETMSDTNVVHHQVKGLSALCDAVASDPATASAVASVRGVCVNSSANAFRGVFVGELKILRAAYLRLENPPAAGGSTEPALQNG